MKHSQLNIPKTIVITVVVFILAAAALYIASLLVASKDSVVVENQAASQTQATKQYFKPRPVGNGIPHGEVMSPNGDSRISLKWVKASVVDGSDTCTLYDTTTKQIYAEYDRPAREATTEEEEYEQYYENSVVSEDDALDIMGQNCFKNGRLAEKNGSSTRI